MLVSRSAGDEGAARRISDSLLKAGDNARHRGGLASARGFAMQDGRIHTAAAYRAELTAANIRVPTAPELTNAFFDVAVMGATPVVAARVDSIVDNIPFRTLPMIDRPYLFAAAMLARVGKPEKARAMLARYRTEMTDTSIARVQIAEYHDVLGEIALAAGKPREALDEFRRADIGFDGAPSIECAPCMSFDLARAYDAARRPDSAAMMFERYLSTPYAFKASPDMDPIRVPAIRERLGQLYEQMGDTAKAIANYHAFIDLWKNADPELQPRVADARRRLARLTQPEQPRH
jgi:tetratricopeptide (TPR) repeat protein